MNCYVTTTDRGRIQDRIDMLLGQGARSPGIPLVNRRLRAATAVPPAEIPADCVTMNSRVRLRYDASGEERVLRLSYPRAAGDADYDPESVSVLSPVGAALLGASVGQAIRWEAPTGPATGVVTEILYQPEASGDPD